MAYATIADMEGLYSQDELIQRTNLDNPDADTIDLDVLQQALDDAQTEMDGYLGRYTLPFAEAPPLLNRLCRIIARKNLYFDAPPMGADQPQWRLDYKDAMRLLTQIAAGTINLGSELAAPHIAVILTSGNPRRLTRRQLRDM